jgi:hypothetical protein
MPEQSSIHSSVETLWKLVVSLVVDQRYQDKIQRIFFKVFEAWRKVG